MASLLESFQAQCNMQEHQPIDVPSLVSPRHECSTEQLRALLPLSIPCASAIYVGVGSIPVNLGRTCLLRNMHAMKHPCYGTSHRSVCLVASSWQGPSYIWLAVRELPGSRKHRRPDTPCSPVLLRVPATLTIYLPDLNCIH